MQCVLGEKSNEKKENSFMRVLSEVNGKILKMPKKGSHVES